MKKSVLPKPNVTYVPSNSDILDERSIKGMICNPIYTGLPPFGQVISDEAWVQAATQLIAEEGPEQFLVNMLYMLRQSMHERLISQLTPPPAAAAETIFELSGPTVSLCCYHDDFPMIEIGGVYVCVAEYIFEHLENAPVTDLIVKPTPTLIFQNGHTLPLIRPSYDPLSEDYLLDTFGGLCIIDAEWDDENQLITLVFGYSSVDEEEDTTSIATLTVHLDSIRQLTCPYHSGAGPAVYSE